MDYEQRIERFYRSVLARGDEAVDVGSHMGRHVLPIAHAVAPTGKVFAFEPLASFREQLRLLLIKEGSVGGGVSVFPYALSSYQGDSEFVVAVDTPGYSGLRERVYDFPTRLDRVRVPVRTLDSFLPYFSAIRLIKIDAEGGEYDVLEGARLTISRFRPFILFEFGMNSARSYGVVPEQVSDLFVSLRFAVFDILGNSLSRHQFSESAYLQSLWDYLAAPEEQAANAQSILRSLTAD